MMRKIVLFCVLAVFFSFLFSISVRAAADCPVCPSGYNWIPLYKACQRESDYVDPIYVDCGSCGCNQAAGGTGCQPPCTSPLHPGLYTCHWSGVAGECLPVSQCAVNYQLGGECVSFSTYQECVNAGPFTCIAAAVTPQVGIGCDICGCPQPGTTTSCPNCNNDCYDCVYNQKKSYTAIGCLPTNDSREFVVWLLGAAIGIGGGIAFLLMIFAGFQIITSTGDPQKLQAGKELLTSAIIGLLVIVFSIFLLKLIGYDILRLPGFESLSPTL